CAPKTLTQLPNGGNVFVACSGAAEVFVLSPIDATILGAPIVTSGAGNWIDASTDGKWVFVGTSAGIDVIDAAAFTLKTTLATGATTFLKFDQPSQRVYAVQATTVSVVDASGTTPSFQLLPTNTPITVTGATSLTGVTALANGT